ncbi:MAG: PEGA domain-containing protein [Oligoflexia bacterium]|nr:PEGA domain-containing protein [Oligoflexia bacterium]
MTINSIPAGAIVYVDDRQLGRSPLSAELGFGMHTIRLELGGYSSEQRTIDVQMPEMAVPFELKPLVVTGTVNIFGPTGATVLVDGAQVGKIPTSVKLTEGPHSFEVKTADGSSFSHSQDVRFDGGTTVSVTLAP